MINQKSSLHYYSDGDILITVKGITFCLHKNILSLCSKVFQDMFKCAKAITTSKEESSTERKIPEISLDDESSVKFQEVLSYIYPGNYQPITWQNVEGFLKLSDKYMMDSVMEASKVFLQQYFRENPLLTLVLSEQYEFKDLYKESSKLVLDQLPAYQRLSGFKYLSSDSRAALFEKHMEYTNSLGRIDAETFVPRFNHINNHVTRHLKDFKLKLSQVIRHLQVLPNPPPSITYKLLSSLIKENNCGYINIQFHLPQKFKMFFENFEPLDCDNIKDEPDYYIFIELDGRRGDTVFYPLLIILKCCN
ncbi:BTB/POZ domain-containing protein [Rhizophagus diaphanus]|nr:BTB/POZ domain-containing protein [Rhizophagus diaphanus] [Rhizophagus sp. MUCL 43196]